MTSAVYAELFGLVERCFVCRQKPDQEPWRFVKDDICIVVCEECNRDYFGLNGELLAEAVDRSSVDPRLLIWWAGRRH